MIVYSNAKPVLADVEPDTFLLDPEKVKEKITKKTKVIAPVHLFGNSCDMKALTAENIDCGVHYPASLTEQPIVKQTLKPKPCPVSEDLSRRIMSLPMHPYLSEGELGKVVEGVEKVANHYIKR